MGLLGFALAAVIGLVLGVLGGGGSILTVPVFVYVLGFAPKLAIAMSLPVVGAVSLVGALGHWRGGNVDLRTALVFGTIAMGGSYAGARVAAYVAGPIQLVLLGVVMLAAAVSMLRRSSNASLQKGAPHARHRPHIVLLVTVGLAVGVLTGLVGIGGGFLIVPALVVLGRVPMKQAIGTSLLVIAMNSVTGFLGYLGQVQVPWAFVGVFTGVAMLGIVVGTVMARHAPAPVLQRAFAVLLIATGALVLYQNRSVFASGAAPATAPGAATKALRSA